MLIAATIEAKATEREPTVPRLPQVYDERLLFASVTEGVARAIKAGELVLYIHGDIEVAGSTCANVPARPVAGGVGLKSVGPVKASIDSSLLGAPKPWRTEYLKARSRIVDGAARRWQKWAGYRGLMGTDLCTGEVVLDHPDVIFGDGSFGAKITGLRKTCTGGPSLGSPLACTSTVAEQSAPSAHRVFDSITCGGVGVLRAVFCADNGASADDCQTPCGVHGFVRRSSSVVTVHLRDGSVVDIRAIPATASQGMRGCVASRRDGSGSQGFGVPAWDPLMGNHSFHVLLEVEFQDIPLAAPVGETVRRRRCEGGALGTPHTNGRRKCGTSKSLRDGADFVGVQSRLRVHLGGLSAWWSRALGPLQPSLLLLRTRAFRKHANDDERLPVVLYLDVLSSAAEEACSLHDDSVGPGRNRGEHKTAFGVALDGATMVTDLQPRVGHRGSRVGVLYAAADHSWQHIGT